MTKQYEYKLEVKSKVTVLVTANNQQQAEQKLNTDSNDVEQLSQELQSFIIIEGRPKGSINR